MMENKYFNKKKTTLQSLSFVGLGCILCGVYVVLGCILCGVYPMWGWGVSYVGSILCGVGIPREGS